MIAKGTSVSLGSHCINSSALEFITEEVMKILPLLMLLYKTILEFLSL